MGKVPGFRVLNGSFGTLYWDGDRIFEVDSFQLTATPNREDVNQAGSVDVDSKMTSIKCEGTFKIKKVYSRGVIKLLDAWKQGRDPRSQLVGGLDDPDAYGSERVVVNNVWFNDLVLFDFEVGKKMDTEFKFGFTLSDVDFPDLIEVQEG